MHIPSVLARTRRASFNIYVLELLINVHTTRPKDNTQTILFKLAGQQLNSLFTGKIQRPPSQMWSHFTIYETNTSQNQTRATEEKLVKGNPYARRRISNNAREKIRDKGRNCLGAFATWLLCNIRQKITVSWIIIEIRGAFEINIIRYG